MYHIQFVQGTMAQEGHLANRIRILDKPAQRHENLTFGWIVSESEEMDEHQVRALLGEHGIDYPQHIPLVYGDYSISYPAWNATFYQWQAQPDDDLPIWMQPYWWMMSQEFPCDPRGFDVTLREWRDGLDNQEANQ